ncbi:uncharacterized protein LOC143837116 isoform X2 [Paroedura picta]|uniref:uncharacterized protein LOC143837116 isoform X2 n=1 Tax=Paroedura picta TaxID=143630 RepID=UPI004057B1C8
MSQEVREPKPEPVDAEEGGKELLPLGKTAGESGEPGKGTPYQGNQRNGGVFQPRLPAPGWEKPEDFGGGACRGRGSGRPSVGTNAVQFSFCPSILSRGAGSLLPGGAALSASGLSMMQPTVETSDELGKDSGFLGRKEFQK